MEKLLKRCDKVAFYGIKASQGNTLTFKRMTGFTEMNTSKNPTEYSRKYVDEEFEQSDVVGYSPSISFSFDRYSDSDVHTDIAKIFDEELTGADAIRTIIVADVTTGAAIKRDFAVIPDSEGDSEDAYTLSGNFKVKSGKIKGTATSEDGWQTITFAEETSQG